ncbi:MAG: hypothetical protein HY236_14205 [Acidobacteria bacterium]|nr:hypothetical protein [Acidobacteriota bacterium]
MSLNIRRKWVAFPFLVAAVLYGAESGTQLLVQVRPEALLLQQDENAVGLRIRLASGTMARIWTDRSCGLPESDTYLVSRSGTYIIPFSAIENKGATTICLSSSDGSISTSLQFLSSR